MGRLIPAGTGMEFYRNVRVERDTTVDQAREEQPAESLSDIIGGDIPAAITVQRPAPVVAEGDGEAEAADDEGDEE